MSTPLFQNSAQVLEWLRRLAQPMTDNTGAVVPETGCLRIGLPESVVETLLPAERIVRGTPKRPLYQFAVEGKNYTLMVRSTRNGNKNCIFAWNHNAA